MKPTKSLSFFLLILIFFTNFLSIIGSNNPINPTTIIFTTNGRSSYAFDIYTLPILNPQATAHDGELRLTDGKSVNFNGHFPSSSSPSPFSITPDQTLIYVTERNGTSGIYLDAIYYPAPDHTRLRSTLQVTNKLYKFFYTTNCTNILCKQL